MISHFKYEVNMGGPMLKASFTSRLWAFCTESRELLSASIIPCRIQPLLSPLARTSRLPHAQSQSSFHHTPPNRAPSHLSGELA